MVAGVLQYWRLQSCHQTKTFDLFVKLVTGRQVCRTALLLLVAELEVALTSQVGRIGRDHWQEVVLRLVPQK